MLGPQQERFMHMTVQTSHKQDLFDTATTSAVN